MTFNDLQTLYDIVEEAGNAIMPYYGKDAGETTKADDSPLTLGDLASNAVILERLKMWAPGIPIVSEEAVEDVDPAAKHWLVDPLDGTKEFLKGHGDFTANIALMENGIPVAGVVFAPALPKGYAAAKGLGAFRVTRASGEPEFRPVQSSKENPLNIETLRIAVSRSHLDTQTEEFIARLQNMVADVVVIQMGSSLKIVHVGDGDADVYVRLGPTSKWDIAAGHAVAAEGHAEIIDLTTNQPLNYLRPEILNPPFAVVSQGLLPHWSTLVALLGPLGQ